MFSDCPEVLTIGTMKAVLIVLLICLELTESAYGPNHGYRAMMISTGTQRPILSNTPTSYMQFHQGSSHNGHNGHYGHGYHGQRHHGHGRIGGLLGGNHGLIGHGIRYHPLRNIRISPFNSFGVQGNIAGIHPGLFTRNGIYPAAAAANPALVNNVLAGNVIAANSGRVAAAAGIVNPVVAAAAAGIVNPAVAAAAGIVNPAVANVAAAAAGRVNPALLASGLLQGQSILPGVVPGGLNVASNPLLAQSGGLYNPLLNGGLRRPDIWQLGLPQQGLRHHRLLQPNHRHHGLFHPNAHHANHIGYGYPFGGGIPPVGVVHEHPVPHPIEHHHPVEHHPEDHHEEPHIDHPHHQPVHPEDLDFIEMNEDAPFQEPSCSRDSEKNWCTEDERYPKKQIELAGHIHAEGLMELYADIADLDTELSVKGSKFLYDESYLCPSDTSYVRPLRAIDEHGKWRVIVNGVKIHHQTLSQTVRIEECWTSGEACPLLPHCYDTKCLQKLTYHRLLVFDPYDHEFPFAIENFRLPASCACKIEKFRMSGHY